MYRNPWKIGFLVLLAALITFQAAAFYYGFRLPHEASGTRADAERSLRESEYRDEAIVLYRAENRNGAIQYLPAACLRMPRGQSEFAWREVPLHETRDETRGTRHCQGAVAFVRPGEGPRHVAYIYDGNVGLPTDLGVSVTLADYLAAVQTTND
jgi:hypothetical protein